MTRYLSVANLAPALRAFELNGAGFDYRASAAGWVARMSSVMNRALRLRTRA